MRNRILIADDNEICRKVLRLQLELMEADLDIIEAKDGIEALQLAPSCDLIILDVLMPGLTGTEVARRIRAHPGHPPLIACTGPAPETIQPRELFDDFLYKPLGKAQLGGLAALVKLL